LDRLWTTEKERLEFSQKMVGVYIQMLDFVGSSLAKTSGEAKVQHQLVSSEFTLQTLVENEGQEAAAPGQPI
jgi:hypothetical protein